MPDLLLELFSEEIPARMQPKARADLTRLITDGLVEAGLTYAGAGALSTPRRLTLALEGLSEASPARREERKGPRTDAPQKAIDGFLRSTGLAASDLERREGPKGEVFLAVIDHPGRKADAIVAEVAEAVIRAFPWPKSMRWGAGSLRWVRPLHSILCLLSDSEGARPVELEIDGIRAGVTTAGHRFMAPDRFAVTSFEDYAAKLKRAGVMLAPDEREAHIRHEAGQAAFAQGLELVEDAPLLAEIAGLVEWPVVLTGAIGEAFLDLPPEVLRISMKEHQKFLSLRNPASGQIEKFVTVANRETADGGATILAGNRKVLAARLEDARFFWENDLRRVRAEGMEGLATGLAGVTFHARLGSQADRVARIAALAREIAPVTGADPALAEQAARVAKADLESEMVGEFPELQGVMGRYYAGAAGLDASVAAACEAHYRPLGPGDGVPDAPVSVAVALADKLDMLTGFWAIGEKPTGSRDPFALRRAALGVIRLALENGLRMPLGPVLAAGFGRHAETEAATQADLLSFLHDRLKVHLREQGVRHDVIDACLAMPGNDDLTLLVKRAEALAATLATGDGENLLQGFRRANNILTQAEAADGVEYSFGPDRKLAEAGAEAELFEALDRGDASIAPALAAEDFAAAMATMASLRGPIDAFFETMHVNAENQVLRRNRLNLLHRVRATCLAVADLTRIEGG